MLIYYTITALVTALCSFLLSFYILFTDIKSPINRGFFYFVSSVGAWSLSYFFWFLAQISNDYNAALFWVRLLTVCIIFIVAGYVHFTINLLELHEQKKKMLILFYATGIGFLLSGFSPLFVKDVTKKLEFPYWPEPGPLLHFFIFFFSLAILYSWYLMYSNMKNLSGIKKTKLKYLFAGTVISLISGSINWLLWYNIPAPPVLNFLNIVFVFAAAYSLPNYRLFNFTALARTISIYLSAYLTVIVIGVLTVFLFNYSAFISFPYLFFSIPVALAVSIFAAMPIFRFYRATLSKYFYYSFYSYQEVITKMITGLTGVIDIKMLSDLIFDIFINIMKINNVGILIRQGDSLAPQRLTGFDNQKIKRIIDNKILQNRILKYREPLICEEIKFLLEKKAASKELINVVNDMESANIEVCLPLLKQDALGGMIILGRRASKEPYSKEDIDLLLNLASQASIAFDNAKLYDQVKDLSENLQKKVDEQTKEIKRAYEVEKKARQDLVELDKVKNQFIIITQHHLRTPLGSIRGYVSSILDGVYGKAPKDITDPLKRVEISAGRLLSVADEFLAISQLQVGKEITILKPGVKIIPIIEEAIEEVKFEADKKRLSVEFKTDPEQSEIMLKADPQLLKLAISNFIDNAVRYTEEGGVDIYLKKGDNKIKIIIKDTGIGMTEKEIEDSMVKLFQRGERAKEMYVVGRGIGLYLSDRIIKAHGGGVFAESEGLNMGSTFTVELPI